MQLLTSNPKSRATKLTCIFTLLMLCCFQTRLALSRESYILQDSGLTSSLIAKPPQHLSHEVREFSYCKQRTLQTRLYGPVCDNLCCLMSLHLKSNLCTWTKKGKTNYQICIMASYVYNLAKPQCCQNRAWALAQIWEFAQDNMIILLKAYKY